ncbi:hypothetical protein P43SY_007801 [Pythium insidiosum]|uniref:BK channel n=1 Tax=Pythium insidiosum TaxID=114742 RepID=A0AAD5M2C0_PYTIN|nr:hypothetical protein P43SY_007801 [Pythium insidiosum]
MMPRLDNKASIPLGFVREKARHMSRQPSQASSRMSMILLGNDSWELFEGIPKHYSLRTRVRMKLRYSNVGLAWELFQTLFAILVSVLYVVQTYKPELNTNKFDLAALGVFSLDYLLNFYCCENRLQFVISFTAIVDSITILPAVLDRLTNDEGNSTNSSGVSSSSFPFLRFIRVLRLLRLTRLIRAVGSHSISAVHKQIHTIMLLITCIVFISAGIFHAIESTNRLPTDPQLTFGEALYFLLVTMATVGYGDIAPLTSGGKAVAATVIVISFTVIPREIARLNQLVALQSQFRRFFQPTVGNPHILVVGHVADPRTLLDFFRELYHPDRILLNSDNPGSKSQVNDPPCVLMGPNEPSEAIINLLDHPILQNRVTFIKGSVMSEEDLCRVGADSARACFVLVPKFADDVQRVDADTVLRLLSIRNYNTDLEVYTQIVSPTYSHYINDVDADHVLCLDQIKLSLLAKSCICPGLVTLVSNMFRSSALTTTRGVYTGWEKEYVEGLALEVYATKLPADFFGLPFTDACSVLYRCTHGEVILLGVYEPHNTPVAARAEPPPQGAGLPTLKVHAMRPRSGLQGQRASDSSRMYINPGRTLLMTAGQIVYVLSESKKLTQTTAISQHLKTWLVAGNTMPLPHRSCSVPPLHSRPDGAAITETREADVGDVLLPEITEAAEQASGERDVLIENAVHPVTRRAIENHIIVVTDLDAVTMQSFMRLLRLPHHTPGSSEYHTVLFLSWTKSPALAVARRALQDYDDAFIMLAAGDSRAEFLRANILRAARCVLLSDKSSVSQLDGETIDSHTIFHYLAILSIQSEFGMDTTSGLMPIVELSIPGTMKILDTALQKRTVRSYLHRQKMEAYLRAVRAEGNAHAGDSESDAQAQAPAGKRRGLHRSWTKKIARQIALQDSTMKLRKRMLLRHSSIRREHDTASHKAGFDSNVSALLPFFAAGYAFADDIFDNMLCQSFYTPGLIRFTYALLFTENGRPPRRFGSASIGPRQAPSGAGDMPPQWIPDAVSDDDERDDDDDDDSGDDADVACRAKHRGVVASSIVQFPVPPTLVGRTFGELFSHLLKKEDVVAIGLFRGSGVAFSLPYVAAGPGMDTTLVKDDLVFALAQPESADRLKPSRKAPPRAHQHPRAPSAAAHTSPSSPSRSVVQPPTRTHEPDELADSAELRRTIERLVLQTR